MDLESLQGRAVSAVEDNVQEFERNQREEAERAEATARLDEVMQAREETFRDMASIAVRHSGGAGRLKAVSMAISVGRVSVPTPFGETVERNLHAVVHNTYEERLKVENIPDLEAVSPESVQVIFSVEAEPGDVTAGLFSGTGRIGWSAVVYGKAKMLYGQRLTSERYDHYKVPVPEEEIKGSPSIDSTMILYAGTNDYNSLQADTRISVINSQLLKMRETLDLLQAGVQ